MMVHINQKRGQSTLEYAVLIIVIIAALIAIQTYIKRGVQGRLKSASDDIGDQYSPGNTNSITAERRVSRERQTFGEVKNAEDPNGGYISSQGLQQTVMVEPEKMNMASKMVIANNIAEDWGN
jgi:Flp pilus assembly pilin Flp